MPLVIQASLSEAGETSLPHHWCEMVLAKRRVLPRSGRIATISGAQAAETESPGNSTTSSLPVSAGPKRLEKNSNSRATGLAKSWAFSLFFSVVKTRMLAMPGGLYGSRNLPETMVPGKPERVQLKLYSV